MTLICKANGSVSTIFFQDRVCINISHRMILKDINVLKKNTKLFKRRICGNAVMRLTDTFTSALLDMDMNRDCFLVLVYVDRKRITVYFTACRHMP